MKKNIFLILLFLALFFLAFKALQQPSVYYRTLGKIGHNYEYREDGNRYDVKKPYIRLTNENIVQWDALPYQYIKEDGYSRLAREGHSYIFAFFPLFPYLWKASHLPPTGIIFLNFILYGAGIILLLRLFRKDYLYAILLLSLPYTVVFLIPYTEALFFFLFVIATLGFLQNRYWLYFLAVVLLSLTRNAFTFLFPAIICAEILFLVKEHNIRLSLKRIALGTLPVITGTLLVMLIQYFQESPEIATFLSSQKEWGHTFSFPNLCKLGDGSHESFGMNIPTMIIIGIPIVVYLGVVFFRQCGLLKTGETVLGIQSANRKDYLWIVCLFCCMAYFFMVFFTQNGDFHGICRFILASPAFAIILCLGFDRLKNIRPAIRISVFALLVLASFLVIITSDYSSFSRFTNFSYIGFIVLTVTLALYLLQDFSGKKIYKLVLCSNFALNIVWSTYLFNMFISNGWLFL